LNIADILIRESLGISISSGSNEKNSCKVTSSAMQIFSIVLTDAFFPPRSICPTKALFRLEVKARYSWLML